MAIIVKQASRAPQAIAGLANDMAKLYLSYNQQRLGQDRYEQDMIWKREQADQAQTNWEQTYQAGRDDREDDIEYRNSEVTRNQGNADREFEFKEASRLSDEAFRQSEVIRTQGNADRNYKAGRDDAQTQISQFDKGHDLKLDQFQYEKDQDEAALESTRKINEAIANNVMGLDPQDFISRAAFEHAKVLAGVGKDIPSSYFADTNKAEQKQAEMLAEAQAMVALGEADSVDEALAKIRVNPYYKTNLIGDHYVPDPANGNSMTNSPVSEDSGGGGGTTTAGPPDYPESTTITVEGKSVTLNAQEMAEYLSRKGLDTIAQLRDKLREKYKNDFDITF